MSDKVIDSRIAEAVRLGEQRYYNAANRREESGNVSDYIITELAQIGARIPDSPRPTLPVVSAGTIMLAYETWQRAPAGSDAFRRVCEAVGPRILRDTVSMVAEHGIVTLRGTMDDVRTWRAMEGTKTIECAGVGVDLLISTLTGSDARP